MLARPPTDGRRAAEPREPSASHRHHHGRERPLGARPRRAAVVRTPRRARIGARGGEGLRRDRGRGPHPLHLLDRELEPPPARGGCAHGHPAGDAARGARGVAREQRSARGDGPHPRPAGVGAQGDRRDPELPRGVFRDAADPRALLQRPRRGGGRGALDAARGDEVRNRSGDGGRGVRREPPLHRGASGPRSPDPHQRRAPALELHAVAARVRRAVDHRHAVAGFPAQASLPGGGGLPAPRAPLRAGGLSAEPRVPATPGEPPAGTAKPQGWSLRWRVASGIVFVPLLVLLARAGGLAFTGFVGLQVTLGLIEFYRMMRGKGLEPDARLGIGAGLGVLWVALHPHGSQGGLLATAFVLLVLALSLRRAPRPRQVESMAVTLFGVLYVGWLSSHFVLLRELPWRAGTDYADGAAYVLLAFFVTWSCDTGAYAIGRMFGRRRPWARISPRKTLEGSIAGLFAAVAGAFIARAWFAPFLG